MGLYIVRAVVVGGGDLSLTTVIFLGRERSISPLRLKKIFIRPIVSIDRVGIMATPSLASSPRRLLYPHLKGGDGEGEDEGAVWGGL